MRRSADFLAHQIDKPSLAVAQSEYKDQGENIQDCDLIQPFDVVAAYILIDGDFGQVGLNDRQTGSRQEAGDRQIRRPAVGFDVGEQPAHQARVIGACPVPVLR